MAERTGTGVVNYCTLIKNEGERLLKLLKDSNVRSIQCKGWDGMGRWRIAEYAANKAMESHLFEVLIWVDLKREDFTPRNMKMKIAESLRIQAPTDAYDNFIRDLETTSQIYKNLKPRNFLLVVGSPDRDLGEMDLVALGVPDVNVVVPSKSFSKVVWVGELVTKMKCDRDLELTVDIHGGGSSAAEVWDLLREEATLAAHSLRNLRFFSPNVVMDWIMYLALFHEFPSFPRKEWLLRFYIAEGIFINNDGEMETTEEVLLEAMDQLREELKHRSILDDDDLYLQRNVEGILLYILKDIQHGFWLQHDSLPEDVDDDDNHGWGAIQKMLLQLSDDEIINLLPQAPKAPNLSSLLARCGKSKTLPPTFFQHMKGLRVLDLSSNSIETLPSSLSSLCNLRFLMLRSCWNINSLPTCLRSLEKLEFVDLSNCSSLEMIPEDSFDLMDRLRVLDLSGTRIQSLPSSVSNLPNLRQLLLKSCKKLIKMQKTGVGLQSLQNLSSLEVLDLSYCNQLEDIRDVSFQHVFLKLRHLNISNTPTPERLLFRGFQSIERLDLSNLENLEVLHLFGCTKLKKLKLKSSKGSSLKRLDILPMENFDKVNIVGKDGQYKVLNWGEKDVGARIWVSNPDFFKSVLKVDEEIFQSKCFSQFSIHISPCREEQQEEPCVSRSMIKIQNLHLQGICFVYKDIYYAYISPHLTAAYSKCLEFSSGDSSPNLEKILATTELVILFNNGFVERLSDLCNATKLKHLKECQIRSCQGIETLFFIDDPDFDIFGSLEVIWASDLPKLTTVCSGVYGSESFSFLKHIFLQHCPKLTTLFTTGVHLQSLKTLEIRYCSRLKNVFGEEVEGREGSLPNLCNLYLFHAPKLKSICNSCLPHLEVLQVHRCPMLRKLPIQVRLVGHGSGSLGSTSPSPIVVEIRGELEWWKDLEWGHANEHNIVHRAHFCPWRHLPATTQKQH